MTLGPLMVDVRGLELDEEERDVLQHPLVGGVILFSRNYDSVEQVSALINSIKALRSPELIIAVDHEGGRVQRFKEGFTSLPAVACLGKYYQDNPQQTLKDAEQMGWLMAAELRAIGVDFSFAPVLDLDYGVSAVIGDRAFHSDPALVSLIAGAYIKGMNTAGMAAIGKHFPGHGAVEVDSHLGLPVDSRDFEDIYQADMKPFETLCRTSLAGVMPAHIVYEQCDGLPAGFSPYWIQTVLRERLGFQGAVLSDDLSMEGAAFMGDSLSRAEAALSAGCDMVLVCNKPKSVIEVIDGLQIKQDKLSTARLMQLKGQAAPERSPLLATTAWQQAKSTIATYQQRLDQELRLT